MMLIVKSFCVRRLYGNCCVRRIGVLLYIIIINGLHVYVFVRVMLMYILLRCVIVVFCICTMVVANSAKAKNGQTVER